MLKQRVFIRNLSALMLWITCAVTVLLFVPNSKVLANSIRPFEQVKQSFLLQAGYVNILDRHGRLIERTRTDFSVRNGNWIHLQDISPAVVRAVIQSEDKRFYKHGGIDWLAVGSAAWSNVFATRARGASTLSMQVAGLISSNIPVPGQRGISDKLTQAKLALRLEKTWTKAEILEAYLNLAWFRGELQGIDAVSNVLFRKLPSGLNMQEAVLIAALLRSPNASVQVLSAHACSLLNQLAYAAYCKELQSFVQQKLSRSASKWAGHAGIAPHFARAVMREPLIKSNALQAQAKTIKTTLDANLQKMAIKSMDEHLRVLLKANVRDGAVVVISNTTGELLAYIGSSGSLSSATHVDHARSLRQAGSTLKPFLYAQAIGQQSITAASLLDNGRLDLQTASGLYVPQNYDKQFSGWVSARTALASSLNIPAVRVLTLIGASNFARTLINLGLPLDKSGEFYGFSLALGSADVSLLTLTNAYRALANNGVFSPVTMFEQSYDYSKNNSVLNPDASWIVGNILADRQARARAFGLDSPLSTPFWSAVKTGTSKDMRDNWVIGWTEHYTVGVWVGNSGGASMHEVSGVSGAGPIWHDIVRYLHKDKNSTTPAMPFNVKLSSVVFEQQIEPPRAEVFIGDTALEYISLASKAFDSNLVQPRIVSPSNGSRLALDPDIPMSNQLLALEAQGIPEQSKEYSWVLNNQVLGLGSKVWWLPRAGTHNLKLLGPNQQLLDQITINIRAL